MTDRPLSSDDAYKVLKCQGRYGYADGYFAQAAKAFSRAPCEECPVRTICWKMTVRGVEDAAPEQVERYQRLVHDFAKQHGISLDRAHEVCKAELLKMETPDPYTARIYANVARGMDDQKIAAGVAS